MAGIPRPLRIGLWSVSGLLGFAVLVVCVLVASFDPNGLKPRIAEAVKQSIGRDLVLNGNISLGLSLQPTLIARDVALANPPQYSRPQMVTLERLDLKLELLPLLHNRIEIHKLVLVHPDVLFENDKQGKPNWEFAPAKTLEGPTGVRPSVPQTSPTRINIVEAQIEDGTFTLRDDASGANTVLNVKVLKTTTATSGSNIALAGEASFDGTELVLDGEVGPLSRLQDPADATPWPMRLSLAAAGAKIAVDGALVHAANGNGFQFKLTGNIPDLAALSAPGHATLPAVKMMAFEGDLHNVTDASGSGIALTGLKLSLPQADLTGDAGITPGSRPAIHATLSSARIDGDALLAAFNPPEAKAVSGTPGKPLPARRDRMFGDTPIPFDLLRLVNADVTFNASELKYGGAQYRSIAQHIALHDGVLRLDPFAADLPEGHLSGSLLVDATPTPAAITLRLHAPGLAIAPVLTMIGMPGSANGNVEVYADLNGAGGTPHDIAAGLNGSLGLAMANGTVGNQLLSSTLGEILRAVNLLDFAERGGASQVQCATARLELTRGVGTFRTLLLSSTLLIMDGDGSVNVGTETLDLRIRSRKQVADTNVVVPLRVIGGWRSPSVTPDPTATVADNVEAVAGAVIGPNSPLGLAAGALGADKLIKRVFGAPEDCQTSLAIARGQAAPPTPARAPVAPQPQAKPKSPNPGDLLRQLFH